MTLLQKAKQITMADLDRLIGASEKQFKVAFLELIAHVASQVDISEVQAALVSGDLGRAIVTTEKLAAGLAGVWAEVYTDAARQASQFLEDSLHLPVVFDQVNTRAVAAVQGTQLRLIREIADEQRDVLREVLADGVRRGLNPRDVARDMRESIGLTRYQESVVQSYRRALESGDASALTRQLRDARFDSTVERYAGSRTGIPAAKVDEMVSRYRQNWVNFRAESIARTEGLRASSAGLQAGFEQAVQTGDVPAGQIERTWLTRHDGRARVSHLEMDRQRRGLAEPFTSGDGNLLMYPRDPAAPAADSVNCRCRLTYRLK